MNERACPSGCVGVIISPGDAFCYKCGAALVARPTCEGCQRPYMMAVERFCPKCGKRLPFINVGLGNALASRAEPAQKKIEGAA